MVGFIELWCKITDDKFYFCEKFTKTQAFFDLLLLASNNRQKHSDWDNEKVIEPGTIVVNLRYLSERWSWCDKTIKRYLNIIKKEKLIDFRIAKKETYINIINWSDYFDLIKDEEPL